MSITNFYMINRFNYLHKLIRRHFNYIRRNRICELLINTFWGNISKHLDNY